MDDSPVTLRSLLALGISGGILPCPSALVVLLGVISLHRVGFGLVLIIAFSIGLAGVLIGIGLLLKYFVERIAGENVDLVFPVSEGLNPIFWMPDPETITDMQQADVIFLNGATYEKWLPFVSLPPSKLVDTAVGFKDLVTLDQKFARVFAKTHDQRFLASHPEFDYLARRYTLKTCSGPQGLCPARTGGRP